MQELLFTRSNGQTVAYFDHGSSEDVLFWHHGTPVAGPIGPLLRHAGDVNNFRIVEVIRPGYGNSSSLPDRTVWNVASINLEVANTLGIDRFGVIGYSGGGPHALATAQISGERCVGAVVAACIAPFVESHIDFYEGMDEASRQVWIVPQEDRKKFDDLTSQYASEWYNYDFEKLKVIINSNPKGPTADERILDMHQINQYSFMHGPNGLQEDYLALLQPWGFSLSELNTPVQIWSGTKDVSVPERHARWLNQNIDGSELMVVAGKDHDSLFESVCEFSFSWLRDKFNS